MYTLKEPISYEEFLRRSREGIVTESGNCPITPVLTLFQGKWKNQVIYELFCCGTMRFGELKKGLQGITNTMLTSALRDLEADGLVQRKQFNEIPPHVEYSLTEKGDALYEILLLIASWYTRYVRENTAPREDYCSLELSI